MKEKIQELIKELEAENSKFSTQLAEKPDMIWTYKSAKMTTISVNKTTITKLDRIIN
jgi:hypothetical protein